jgi:hypothetical protein
MDISIIKPELSIVQSKIHEIRGMRVILDYDLAEIYGIETKRLKEAVRRNIERFPEDFMFVLTREEYNRLRSQFATIEISGRGKYSKYQSFAFTEQGVAMLASILSSPAAIEVNIQIVRAFVFVRQCALNYAELNRKLDDYMDRTDTRIEDIYEVLDELVSHKKELEKTSQSDRLYLAGKETGNYTSPLTTGALAINSFM